MCTLKWICFENSKSINEINSLDFLPYRPTQSIYLLTCTKPVWILYQKQSMKQNFESTSKSYRMFYNELFHTTMDAASTVCIAQADTNQSPLTLAAKHNLPEYHIKVNTTALHILSASCTILLSPIKCPRLSVIKWHNVATVSQYSIQSSWELKVG